MTRDDFEHFRHAYGGQETPGSPPGFWPHAPLTRREAPLWFRKLQPYPLPRVLAALEEISMQDRRQAPSVQQVLEAMQRLAPPAVPVPDWQQDLAVAQGLTLTELFQAARPAHTADEALARCFREIADAQLYLPSRAAAYIAACERFAARYPADRAFWEAQIAARRAEMAEAPTPGRPPRSAAQVGTFTHLGALLPGRRGRHA